MFRLFFKVSVAKSKKSSCGGSKSRDTPTPAATTSDLPSDIFSSSSSHHPHRDKSTAVPPLTNTVSFSHTTLEANMSLSNNTQANPFAITQSLDPSAHVKASDPTYTSATNTFRDNTDDIVQPQRQLILPNIQPPVYQGDPLAWIDWFGLLFRYRYNAAISQTDGEPKALIVRYGCNPAMYQYALSRLKSTYGKPDRIVISFLQRLKTFP